LLDFATLTRELSLLLHSSTSIKPGS